MVCVILEIVAARRFPGGPSQVFLVQNLESIPLKHIAFTKVAMHQLLTFESVNDKTNSMTYAPNEDTDQLVPIGTMRYQLLIECKEKKIICS